MHPGQELERNHPLDEKLPRSKKPLIPEPRHRVGPEGVSSGISFRKLPKASLNEIRKTCNHYEAKCEGEYNSLASRYIRQMGQEIRVQIDALENSPSQHCSECHIHEATSTKRGTTCSNSEKVHGKDDYRPKSDKTIVGMHRKALKIKVQVLEDALQKTQNKLNQSEMKAARELLKRKNINLKENVFLYQKELDSLKISLKEERLNHENEINKLKRDAKQIINFVRKKANETLVDTESKYQETIKELHKNMTERESEYKNRFSSHLERMEHQICDVMRSERAALTRGSDDKNVISTLPETKNPHDSMHRPISRSFFPDDTITTMLDGSPSSNSHDSTGCTWMSSRGESLEVLTDELLSNVRLGFQSILDGKEKEMNQSNLTLDQAPKNKYREPKRNQSLLNQRKTKT